MSCTCWYKIESDCLQCSWLLIAENTMKKEHAEMYLYLGLLKMLLTVRVNNILHSTPYLSPD